jgi:hypothetical protein
VGAHAARRQPVGDVPGHVAPERRARGQPEDVVGVVVELVAAVGEGYVATAAAMTSAGSRRAPTIARAASENSR